VVKEGRGNFQWEKTRDPCLLSWAAFLFALVGSLVFCGFVFFLLSIRGDDG
jgi:hypothetical protein